MDESKQLITNPGWTGLNTHPDAPAGGGGPGNFHQAGVASKNGKIDHRSPAARHHTTTPRHALVHVHHNKVKRAAKHAAAIPLSTTAAATLLDSMPEVRAMLDTLAYSEGTGDEYGMVVHGTVIDAPNPKDIGRVNVIITDFSNHPHMLVQVNKKLKSTAAGRYQFLVATWEGLQMSDFTPRSQDLACVKLFARRKMIDPLIHGDFKKAVQLGCLEWASLPDLEKGGNSHYGGQPSRSYTSLQQHFNSALARYQIRQIYIWV